MLTRATRIRLAVFGLVAVLIMVYTGIHYADLGRLVGLRGYYVVRLNLASSGGIYSAADVTYRGVSVGRVGAMRLTDTGIEVNLDISDSAPPIPTALHASVADLSAVGEQYVDLLPKVLDAASRLAEAPNDATMSALAERTAADPLFV